MRIIECLIVEDDLKALAMAESLLSKYFDNIELDGKIQNIKEAQAYLKVHSPDLVILDVNLPDGTAFDLLHVVDLTNTKIIFTTAHSKYAVEAFKFSALDFLLKPYTPNAFKRAVEKAIDVIRQDDHRIQLETFYHNSSVSVNSDKKIVLKSKDKIDVVAIKDIIRAEADDNYSKFILTDGRTIMVSRPLKEFDEKLSSSNFFRTHQSHLINLQHMISLNKKDMTLSLGPENTEIPVAQSKKSLLMAYLDQLGTF